MSLKKVHVLFITLASLCCLAFGLWCFIPRAGSASPALTMAGVASIVCGCAVAVYGMWFYRNKIRGIETAAAVQKTR